jgi:hypothetical protein
MDELQLVRELGTEVPLRDATALEPTRARLLAESAAHPPVQPRRPRRPRWRLAWAGGLTAGLAAALAVVLVAGHQTGSPTRTGGHHAPAAVTDPAQVLRLAADETRSRTFVEPRADQFLYTKTQNPTSVVETWASVDGTHDGLMIEHVAGRTITTVVRGCVDGKRLADLDGKPNAPKYEDCQPTPAYQPNLPTDSAHMLTYLDQQAKGGTDTTNSRAKNILELAGRYLRPATQAALFEAASKVPGLTLVKDAKDAAGRPGVGISWPSGCSDATTCGATMVFDTSSYALLGTNYTATLASGVVDTVQQTP